MTAIQESPLTTLAELGGLVRSTLGFQVSKQLIATIVSRNGFTRKKARFYGKPKDLEAKTSEFLALRSDALSARDAHVVSIDETSFGRHTGPAFGYSERGSKVFVRKARAHITTTTVVACVSADGVVHRKAMPGSCNKLRFTEFLRESNLPRGTTILLDNVRFHHSRDVRSFAEAAGLRLLFVPPYSPWFNPIEGCFSIVKRAFYRGLSVDDAFATLRPSHCRAFFDRSLATRDRF